MEVDVVLRGPCWDDTVTFDLVTEWDGSLPNEGGGQSGYGLEAWRRGAGSDWTVGRSLAVGMGFGDPRPGKWVVAFLGGWNNPGNGRWYRQLCSLKVLAPCCMCCLWAPPHVTTNPVTPTWSVLSDSWGCGRGGYIDIPAQNFKPDAFRQPVSS